MGFILFKYHQNTGVGNFVKVIIVILFLSFFSIE